MTRVHLGRRVSPAREAEPVGAIPAEVDEPGCAMLVISSARNSDDSPRPANTRMLAVAHRGPGAMKCLAWVLLLSAAFPSSIRADVVYLKNGAVLEGEVWLSEDGVVVEIRRGMKTTLAKSEVVRIETREPTSSADSEASGPPASDASDWVVYRGTRRSPQWVEQQYQYFKDKIAQVDGNYYSANGARWTYQRGVPYGGFWICAWRSAGKGGALEGATPEGKSSGLLGRPDIDLGKPSQVGQTAVLGGAQVVQVLGPRQTLVRVHGKRNVTDPPQPTYLLLENVAAEGMALDQRLPTMCIVVAGTYSYTSTLGGTNTVFRVRPIEPLTREQFLDVLGQDIPLTRWNVQEFRCPKCSGKGWICSQRARTTTRVTRSTMLDCGARARRVQPVSQPHPLRCSHCEGAGQVTQVSVETLR